MKWFIYSWIKVGYLHILKNVTTGEKVASVMKTANGLLTDKCYRAYTHELEDYQSLKFQSLEEAKRYVEKILFRIYPNSLVLKHEPWFKKLYNFLRQLFLR